MMKIRQRIKNQKFKCKYKLLDVKEYENHWDGNISISGVLYYNNVKVIVFYEHDLEGGYYPNGTPHNIKLYDDFLKLGYYHYKEKFSSNIQKKMNFDKTKDELTYFDKGITLLVENE